MVLGGIVSSYGRTYSQTVTKNKQTDSSYESKSENLPTTDNTPDNAEAKTSASVQDLYNGLTTYYKGVPLEQWASSDPKYTDAGEIEKNDITDYIQFIQDYIDKLYVKIKNGDTETKFQIGNQSFTINEWDEFLEKFDSAENVIQEQVEEEIENRKQN
jgi:hypothetical protein